MERLPANPVPKSLRMSTGDNPPSRPVTTPATVTTSMGLSFNANPTTTTAIPSRTHMAHAFRRTRRAFRGTYGMLNNATRG